jgi:hypothetical protein
MEKIFKQLDFVLKQTEDILLHFNGVEREDVLTFCYCMIKRLNFAADGVKVLMDKFLSNVPLEYSAGIIMRSVFLDFLIVLNASEIIDKYTDLQDKVINSGKDIAEINKELDPLKKDLFDELKRFCSAMLTDSIIHTLNDFSMLYPTASKSQKTTFYSGLVNSVPERFTPYNHDGSVPVPICQKTPKSKEMFKNIRNSKRLNGLQSIFDAYSYYSKYDHFGQMFLLLSEREPIKKLEMLSKGIKVFPKFLLFTLIILAVNNQTDSFFTDKINTVTQFIDNLDN